jgi:predicted ATP-grasp superfamily ATP-dependent carboligase
MPAERVLIVGLSGRALAASARVAGYAPIVLDAFADLDTKIAALALERVPVNADWRFDRDALLSAAARLAPPPIPLVVGSGFDRHPDLLELLAKGRELLGCPPQALTAAKDPLRFARLLDQLGIPHPEVRLDTPADPSGWLVKRIGGAGGAHVRRLKASEEVQHGRYLQREQPGRPVSVLVASNGGSAVSLALSEQWPDPAPGRPFRYGGAAAPADLPAELAAGLRLVAERIAAAAGLKGLGSLDTLVDDHTFSVLELNMRPGAAIDAYERASGSSLFALHVAAARGDLGLLPSSWRRAAAALLLWAPEPMAVDSSFRWPPWTADRTRGGTRIPPGAPICTVLGEGLTAIEARQVAETRGLTLLSRLRRQARRAG